MATPTAREAAELLEGKQSKQSVNYRPSSQEQDDDWCGSCISYLNPGKVVSPCAKVAGDVHDGDVCDLFQEAPEEDDMQIPREEEEGIVNELL